MPRRRKQTSENNHTSMESSSYEPSASSWEEETDTNSSSEWRPTKGKETYTQFVARLRLIKDIYVLESQDEREGFLHITFKVKQLRTLYNVLKKSHTVTKIKLKGTRKACCGAAEQQL
jgi:hypothetical protein